MSGFVASLAARILSRYLGDYVEGLDSKNLEISLLSGSVELKNLKLKTSSLEKLDLPVTVKEGEYTVTVKLTQLQGSWEGCICTSHGEIWLVRQQ